MIGEGGLMTLDEGHAIGVRIAAQDATLTFRQILQLGQEFALDKGRDPLQPRRLSVRWVGALKRWIPRMEAHAPLDFPLAVVQGDEDGTVDGPHNLGVIRQKFPAAEIHVIPHGRHQLANEAPALRAQALGYVTAMLAAGEGG